jgi:hypothetical protein
MLGKVVTTKNTNIDSPIVDVYINNICIPNTLIDLGATINVMTRETKKKLKLTNLHQNGTVLQMANQSTIEPEGILEDIIISIDSCEYPKNFIFLQPKSNLGSIL